MPGLAMNETMKISDSSTQKTQLSSEKVNEGPSQVDTSAEDSTISSEIRDDARGNFYPTTGNKRVTVRFKPPNSKGSEGRRLLALTVRAAIENATQAGNLEIAEKVQRMYEMSLSDPLLAELMDAVLAQKATKEQTLQFRAYTEKTKVIDAQVSQLRSSLTGGGPVDERDTKSTSSGNHDIPRDEGMNETGNQRSGVNRSQKRQKQATSSNNNEAIILSSSSMADHYRNQDASDTLMDGVQPPDNGTALPRQPTLRSKSKSKKPVPASNIKTRGSSNQKSDRGKDASRYKSKAPQAKSRTPKNTNLESLEATHSMVTHGFDSMGAPTGQESSKNEDWGAISRRKTGFEMEQISVGERSLTPDLIVESPLVGNINTLKAKLECTPNSKTVLGRQSLSIVIDACVSRSAQEGNPVVGQAIKKFYDESLSDPLMAGFFDRLFVGEATREQVLHFQGYVRDCLRGARAKHLPPRPPTDGIKVQPIPGVAPKSTDSGQEKIIAPSGIHTMMKQSQDEMPLNSASSPYQLPCTINPSQGQLHPGGSPPRFPAGSAPALLDSDMMDI